MFIMEKKNDNNVLDGVFSDIFDDVKKEADEIGWDALIARNREESRKRAEEGKKLQETFLSIARQLPGAENERDDNPIVSIECTPESGMKAVTSEEKIAKDLDRLFQSFTPDGSQQEEKTK